MHVIEIDNLTRDYRVGFPRKRTVRALDGLSLDVKKGEVFGFLGPNGAGKTTTFRVLMGLVSPTSGTARILGKSLDDHVMKARIGYLPEQPHFYDHLTPAEFLVYCGLLSEMSRADSIRRAATLLDRFGLADSGGRHLRHLSKGMLQRVGLAQALMHDPDILFLDEPMSGHDTLGRGEVRDLIISLRGEGKTIFFSSHILSDVQAMCDRVAILDRGRRVEYGRLTDILTAESCEMEAMVSGIGDVALDDLRRLGFSVEATPAGARVRLDDDQSLGKLIEIVHRHAGRINSVNPVRESLEDRFVRTLKDRSG